MHGVATCLQRNHDFTKVLDASIANHSHINAISMLEENMEQMGLTINDVTMNLIFKYPLNKYVNIST